MEKTQLLLISGCLYLYTGTSSFFWASLTPPGPYRLSKLQHLVLTKCLIKIMLNAFFSSAFYFFMQYAFTYCQIPVHHQLYLQHLCSSCILGQFSFLKDVLTHPSSKRHSQEFASLPEVCRRL